MTGSRSVFAKTDQDFIRRLADAGIEIRSVYDVGASNGLWSYQIAGVIPKATFDLFEPNESVQYADMLEATLKAHPDFRMHRVALGDKDGTLSLHVTSDHSGATLIASDWEGFVERKPTAVRSLDGLVAKLRLPQPDVIKMDTQGFELKILQGAEKVCSHTKALILETWLD